MPATATDKLIVSNSAALVRKYKASGWGKIEKAVKRLIKADAARSINTVFVDLADPAMMSPYKLNPVPLEGADGAELTKRAIDAIFTSGETQPAYLMLLGSTDVIPHVLLDNPLAGDGDENVPSDLPYACDKPFGTDVQDFTAPTRVVGRLPDVTNGKDADYLVGLLDTAAGYTGRPASAYKAFLGISAQVWKKSSELSLDAIFGADTGIKISPPDGYKWPAAEAKRLSHFVNCHGAAVDPNFYGQKGASYPVAHSAAWVSDKVVEATVLAAECCYGAELYDPSLPTAGGQMGMCNTYLGRKAYAYFGSTNIAYGPDASNDQADLMCQYFLSEILGTASAGRACLEARLRYVQKKGGVLGPADLKTLAQFNLMADPSLTPVSVEPWAVPIPSAGAKSRSALSAILARFARFGRRAAVEAVAEAIPAFRLRPPVAPPGGGKTGAFGKLRKLAADHGIKAPDVLLSYSLTPPPSVGGRKGLVSGSAGAGAGPKAVHVVLERLPPPKSAPRLALVRGIQAIEFDEGMIAEPFQSR